MGVVRGGGIEGGEITGLQQTVLPTQSQVDAYQALQRSEPEETEIVKSEENFCGMNAYAYTVKEARGTKATV